MIEAPPRALALIIATLALLGAACGGVEYTPLDLNASPRPPRDAAALYDDARFPTCTYRVVGWYQTDFADAITLGDGHEAARQALIEDAAARGFDGALGLSCMQWVSREWRTRAPLGFCTAKAYVCDDTLAPQPGAAANPEALGGVWRSDRGRVELSFTGANFTGVYPGGTLEGGLDPNSGRVSFRWAEPERRARGRGVWIVADARHLRGSWGHDRSATNGATWTLTRDLEEAPDQTPPPVDLMTLSGAWSSNHGAVDLLFRATPGGGAAFAGTFPSGSLSGRLDPETGLLVFRWIGDQAQGQGAWRIERDGALRGEWGRGDSADDLGEWRLSR